MMMSCHDTKIHFILLYLTFTEVRWVCSVALGRVVVRFLSSFSRKNFGFHLLVILLSSLCMMFGPGKA